MPEPIGPAVARDWLRARLRQLREAHDMSPEGAAATLHLPLSELDNIEAGRRMVHPLEVAAMLAAYGVTDDATVTALTALAYRARSPLWWSRNGLSDAYQLYTGYESVAEKITVYQPLIIPGLLQTVPYARAATAAILGSDPDSDEVRARVDIRIERQQVLAERLATGTTPRLLVILEEAVLRRPLGGDEVFLPQLDHVIAAAGQPHVTLVVMPTGTGGHAGLGGVFELLEFDGASDLVYIESLTGDSIVRDARATARYRENAGTLHRTGATGDAAVEMIEEAKLFRTGT